MNTHKPYGPYEKFIKRPLDCLLASGALVVLSPIMGVTALLVKRKLGSPVLFTQERPGKDGKLFKLYKFRSMTDERDENGELLPDEERVTRFGTLLRSTSLDELPELFNIVKGDMAIIGPRPLLVQYLPYYTENEKHRHDVRPGLSGLAQVMGRNNTPWDKRFEYDLEYVNNINLKNDLRIAFLTLNKILTRADVVIAGKNSIDDLDKERE